MAKNKTTVRFWLRTDRANQNGTAPIHIIYQVQGNRRYYAIPGVLILPLNWNEKLQQAVYLPKSQTKGQDDKLLLTAGLAADLNERLSDIIIDIKAIENDFRDKGKILTAADVIASLKQSKELKTKKESQSKDLHDFIDRYVNDHKLTREKSSLSIYKGLNVHLKAFEKDRKRKASFDNIDYSFLNEFQNYLISERDLNNTTVAKHISTLKTMLSYAHQQGKEVNLKYKDFKIKRDSLEVIALTGDEFQSIFDLDLSASRPLREVRDVFCFSCVTGLRYSDLAQLKKEHIKKDEIKIVVKKTKEQLSVPLNKFSQEILDRYKDTIRPLPVISNQKSNKHLKKIAEMAGINELVEIVRYRGTKREAITYPKHELITMHVGRKSFISLSLERGISAEVVMTISGHLDHRSFARYVLVTEQRKKVSMKEAWGDISATKLKVV